MGPYTAVQALAEDHIHGKVTWRALLHVMPIIARESNLVLWDPPSPPSPPPLYTRHTVVL